MRIAVIGAGGFVGQHVVRDLAARSDVSAIHALDRAGVATEGKVIAFQGDFADPTLRAEALSGAGAVIHLAAVLGGAAEADPALARRVNLDATLDLIDALKDSGTRFVFASTVAAYGQPMPDPVTDATPLGPSLLYGAQKVMIEVLLSSYARRGWLDAVSLRPSGIMARDGVDAGLKTAFMSHLFYCVKRSEDITLPVAEDSTTWMASRKIVARNFLEAALMPDLGPTRALTLPALQVRFGDLVAALRRVFPDSSAQVAYAPDAEIISLFGNHPKLETDAADALGLSRDADIDALIAGSL